jgi:hypothetical protein
MSRGHGAIQRKMLDILSEGPATTTELVRRVYGAERYSDNQRIAVNRGLARFTDEGIVVSKADADKGGKGHDRIWRLSSRYRKRRTSASSASVAATA